MDIYNVMFMILVIVAAFIGGAILHIFVYIVGGRRGIAKTIKAGMYGSTLSLLFGSGYASSKNSQLENTC